MSKVSPPECRDHERYYRSSEWTVVDVDNVDRLAAIESFGHKVRLDIDGEAQTLSEVGEKGDRINLSVYIDAKDLLEAVEDSGVLDK